MGKKTIALYVRVSTSKQDLKSQEPDLKAWLKVNRKGREKVLREKRKNVHAGVRGYMGESTWDTYPEELFDEVTYNPYKYESFVMKDTEASRWFANQVRLQPNKVLVTPS